MSSDHKWSPKDDEIEDEEEEEDTTRYQDQKDAILFAIHVSESMLAVHEDDSTKDLKKKHSATSAVRTALECAYAVLQQRIISSKNDMMGILLYGVEQTRFRDETSSSSGFAHCYTLMDLDIPDAEGIKALKNLLEDEEAFNELMVPTTEKVSMANVLFAANQILTTKAPNFQSRKLFIITDDDDPHADNATLRTSAITRAKDLYDLGILIEPFFITNPGQPPFDPSKFYNDIIYRSPLDYDEKPLELTDSGTTRLKSMITSIRSKAAIKRALFSTPLEIAPGLTIGIKGYLPFKRQEKDRSYYIFTGAEKPQIAHGSTTIMSEATAKVVEKTELRKAYKFGGEQIVFSQEEMKAMRLFGEPVVRIIGFKSARKLRFDHNVRSSIFVYPDEKDYIGSTRTFTALHSKLLRDKKIGVCWCVTRRNAAPVLCALYPSPEEVVDGRQTNPAGFFLIQLPFADDIRQPPASDVVRAPGPLIDAMRAIVKQLHMPKGYDPEKFENPALQWHYRILQAIALEEDLPEEPEDRTKPKYRLIHKYATEFVQDWGRVLKDHGEAVREKMVKAEGGKRVAEDGDGGEKKRVSLRDVKLDLKELHKQGKLDKATVSHLKAFCKENGLAESGRKPELLERVEEYLDNA